EPAPPSCFISAKRYSHSAAGWTISSPPSSTILRLPSVTRSRRSTLRTSWRCDLRRYRLGGERYLALDLERWIRLRARESFLLVGQPARHLVGDNFHLGAERKRKVRHLVARRKIHQDRHVEIGQEIEQEVLELVFLRAVER